MTAGSAHDLTRFIEAQARVFDDAIAELRHGEKTTHWMWFIFPQLRGLGRTEIARHYGIADLREARSYLAHPVLGPRLTDAALAMLRHSSRPAHQVLGEVDALKLRSSATLFYAAGGGPEFREILRAFYGGQPCPLTLDMLRKSGEQLREFAAPGSAAPVRGR